MTQYPGDDPVPHGQQDPPDGETPVYGSPPPDESQPAPPPPPGYAEPGYATPGYGAPGYSGPGYGGSGNEGPSYGAPDYPPPDYGAPGQETPGHGTPGHGTPSPGTPAHGLPGYGQPGAEVPPSYGQPPPHWGPPASGQPAGPSGYIAMTEHEERQWAMLAHFGGVLAIFPVVALLPSLIIYSIYQGRSDFVRDQAREALNFQLTVLIAYVVARILAALPLLPNLVVLVWVFSLVFSIIAGRAAYTGQRYRYPFTFRFLS